MRKATEEMSGIQRKGAGDPYLNSPSGNGLGLVASKRNVKLELLNEQRDEINDAFDMFDMNHDGFLDYHEAKVAFRALGFDLGKRRVLEIIREYDLDNRNLIGFENFAETVSRMMQDRDPMDEIRRAFKLFDEDNTGKISLRNLRKISKELGENLSEEELHAMIDEFDLDEDGEINEEEFIRICTE